MGSVAHPLLYGRANSSCACRVRIALNLKQIQYVYKSVTSDEARLEEFAKLNPQRLVPAFVAGDLRLSQRQVV